MVVGRVGFLGVVFLGLAWGGPVDAAQPRCDTALVLAMDVSGSVSETNFRMQRDGTAEALESDRVMRAIGGGGYGQIAVAVTQWSDAAHLTVPWIIVRSPADARRLAEALRDTARLMRGSTAIGSAIRHAVEQFRDCPCVSDRLVVDVSGDGRRNSGIPMERARLAAEALGVTVNGLAIRNDEPDVARWYDENVRMGLDAFLIEAESFADFARAIRIKLETEISGRERRYAGLEGAPRSVIAAYQANSTPVAGQGQAEVAAR
jgi:hypothetical protein